MITDPAAEGRHFLTDSTVIPDYAYSTLAAFGVSEPAFGQAGIVKPTVKPTVHAGATAHEATLLCHRRLLERLFLPYWSLVRQFLHSFSL